MRAAEAEFVEADLNLLVENLPGYVEHDGSAPVGVRTDCVEEEWLLTRADRSDGAVAVGVGAAVRVGRVRRGGPATVGGWRDIGTPVDKYEVLLDQGAWEWMDRRYENEEDDDSAYYVVPPGAVACGHGSDGGALYAATEYRDDEMGGAIPSETGDRAETNWERKVLIDPVAANAVRSAPPPAPAVPVAPAPAKPVVTALSLEEEAVTIANAGGVAIDIGGWKLRDDSNRKPFTFPAGTTLAPGASIVIRSGPGAANVTAGQLAWTTASVWNDRGDTAALMDASGNIVSAQKGH